MPTFIGGIIPNDVTKPGIAEFVNQALSNLAEAHDAISESRVVQTYQSNIDINAQILNLKLEIRFIYQQIIECLQSVHTFRAPRRINLQAGSV